MARIVVLRFDDDKTAEEFVKNGKDFLDATYDVFWGGVSLVGLFAMPTMFCPSSGSGGCSQSKRVRAWQRGRKFGWWVCAVCKKPSGFVPPGKPNEIWRRVVSQGVNLLRNPDDQDLETTRDEGWGAMSHG